MLAADLRAQIVSNVLVDFNGDGKSDWGVIRRPNPFGAWTVHISYNGQENHTSQPWGKSPTDVFSPVDYDGDGKSDFSVYRPAEETWFTLNSSSGNSSARRFGLATDVPAAGDFDGDGFADLAQFRNGFRYILNSTTAFEASRFGTGEGQSIVGDYDGDGRADTTTFHNGLWSIRDSGSGIGRNVYFGLPTDIPVK